MKPTLTLLVLLWCGVASAAVHPAASTSGADVQAAINLCASSGDTVTVPAGSSTWNQGDVSMGSKGIMLIAAGTNLTHITFGAGNQMLIAGASGSNFWMVSGFDFTDSVGGAAFGILTVGEISKTNEMGRVCSNRFNKIVQSGMYVAGWSKTLVDHNEFFQAGSGNAITGVGATASTDAGTNSWLMGPFFGTTNSLCMESNTCWCTSFNDGVVDFYGGFRATMRYNIVYSNYFGMHGTDSGGYRSTHSTETYGNIIHAASGWSTPWPIQYRGGTHLAWGNTCYGAFGSASIALQNFRCCGIGSLCGMTGNCGPWDYMTGANPYDGNIVGDGWPGFDQIGETGPTTWAPGHSIQVLYGCYQSNNIVNGGPLNFGPIQGEIVINRDYFDGSLPNGYTPLGVHPLWLKFYPSTTVRIARVTTLRAGKTVVGP